MSIRSSVVLALLLPAIYGCEDAESRCEAASEVPPHFELGVGEKHFEAVRDGEDLPVSWGNQGGRHIWVGAYAEGVEPGRSVGKAIAGPTIAFSLEASDGSIVANGWAQQPMDGDENSAEIAGIEMYVEMWQTTLADEQIDLSALLFLASLQDSCGVELQDERTVSAEGLL